MRIRVSQITAAWRREEELHCQSQSRRAIILAYGVPTLSANLVDAGHANMLPPAPRGSVPMELFTSPTALSALLSMMAQPLAPLPLVLATAQDD